MAPAGWSQRKDEHVVPEEEHAHLDRGRHARAIVPVPGSTTMAISASHFVTRLITGYRTRADERSWRRAAYPSRANWAWDWIVGAAFVIVIVLTGLVQTQQHWRITQSELETARQAADLMKAQASELAKRVARQNSQLEEANAQPHELQAKLDQAMSEVESAQSQLKDKQSHLEGMQSKRRLRIKPQIGKSAGYGARETGCRSQLRA